MPISFEQPGAVSQGVYAGYGALEQEMANRQFALQRSAAMGSGGGGGYAQQPATSFGIGGVGGGGGHGGGGGQLDAIALASQAQSEQLSQAEHLRYQRLQNGRAAVQEQMDNNQLSQEDGRALQLQIETQIDPYQQRMHRAQAALMESQNQGQLEQRARITALTTMDQAGMAQALQRRIVSIPDPTTGRTHQFYLDHQGNPHPMFAEARGSDAETAHQIATRDQHEDDRFRAALTTVEQTVLGRDSATTTRATPTDAHRQQIEDMMRARGFHSSDLSTHQFTRNELRTQRPMTGRPETSWTPQQREESSDLDALQSQVNQYRDTQPTWVREMTAELRRARTMFHQAGTTLRMPRQGANTVPGQAYLDIIARVRRQLTLPNPNEGQQGSVRSAAQTVQGPVSPPQSGFDNQGMGGSW